MSGITKSLRSCINCRQFMTALLIIFPFAAMLWVWFSSLSFVPVPWPDDSAFYFVAKELFKWPPRWVMLPQAPFEPTYRIWNFNTMPLYPILLGLGRLIGIDGIFAIKIFPLGAWAMSGSLLGVVLYKKGLPFLLSLLIAMTFMMDPTLRWASVIVRPESLIGLCGGALVLGLTFGFPERLKPTKFWNPISALLVTAAYAHFNAVHLLFPVLLSTLFSLRQIDIKKSVKQLLHIGATGLLYLSPWLFTVIIKFPLFIHQMTTQWTRLSYGNNWLSTTEIALKSLFQDLGSPEPWPEILYFSAYFVAAFIFLGLIWGIVIPLIQKFHLGVFKKSPQNLSEINLLPAGAWLLGSLWIWDSKPEVWFTSFLHLSLWTFMGLATLKLYQTKTKIWAVLAFPIFVCLAIFTHVNVSQAERLSQTQTWKWPIYRNFIDCIDQQLIKDNAKNNVTPYRVWAPTFPDVTIELSLRHPDWEFTRTNDFAERANLAVQHGRDVEAVVVPEMINWTERQLSEAAPATSDEPVPTSSVWMTWKAYFLNRLWIEKGWKPNRYICQRGRWQAFIFFK